MTDITERGQMLLAIAREWDASQTPADLQQAFADFQTEQRANVERLNALISATMAWWIIKGREAGHDPDILDQVALQSGQWAIASISKAMKVRQGKPFSPARVAIVAYAVAELVANTPVEPGRPDLEGLTQAVDEIEADTASERDSARRLVKMVADITSPEQQMREVITRCRSEVMKWEAEGWE